MGRGRGLRGPGDQVGHLCRVGGSELILAVGRVPAGLQEGSDGLGGPGEGERGRGLNLRASGGEELGDLDAFVDLAGSVLARHQEGGDRLR